MVTEPAPAESTAEPAPQAATQPSVAEPESPSATMAETVAAEPVAEAVVGDMQIAVGHCADLTAIRRRGPSLRFGGLAGDGGQGGSEADRCTKPKQFATRHHDVLQALRYKLGRHVGSRFAALTLRHAVVRVP